MSFRDIWILGTVLVAAMATTLLLMGRIPLCECGYVKVWTPASDVSGSSQHIADWYTFSHIIHGMIFYAMLHWFMSRRGVGERALVAIAIEAAWEIVENSPWIIDRYREATIAVGYNGDSVLNSVFDVVWMLSGFWLAWRLPVWLTVVLAITFELVALWVIRDNLTLNVVMLLYPIEGIRIWQGGG